MTIFSFLFIQISLDRFSVSVILIVPKPSTETGKHVIFLYWFDTFWMNLGFQKKSDLHKNCRWMKREETTGKETFIKSWQGRVVFRIFPNVQDVAFSKNSQQLKAVNYFHRKLRLRYLTGLQKRLCKMISLFNKTNLLWILLIMILNWWWWILR